MDAKTREIFRRAMREIGAKGGKIGGKRSLETMTPEERTARAKKASEAAARKRTATRLARERAAKKPRAESEGPVRDAMVAALLKLFCGSRSRMPRENLRRNFRRAANLTV